MNLVSLYLYLTKPPRGKVLHESLLVAYLVQKFPNCFMVPEASSVYQSPSLVKILSKVSEIQTLVPTCLRSILIESSHLSP
jgi:hypothetical protein